MLVLPSAYVPMAVNDWVKPTATNGAGGLTAIDTSGLLTVRLAVPEMLPEVAMMVEVAPGVTPVAKPPAVIVAPTDALHVTLEVMSCGGPLAKVPVAVNCCVPLGAMVAEEGVTAIDTNALVTVSAAVPVMLPEVADIVLVPAAMPVASPEVLIVATAVLDDSQLAATAFVLPSLYVPVAVNCCVFPAVIEGLAGVTWIEESVTAGGLFEPDPDSRRNQQTDSHLITGTTAATASLAPPGVFTPEICRLLTRSDLARIIWISNHKVIGEKLGNPSQWWLGS